MKNNRIWDLLDDMQNVLAIVMWGFIGIIVGIFITNAIIETFAGEPVIAVKVVETAETTSEPPAEKVEIKQEIVPEQPEPEPEPEIVVEQEHVYPPFPYSKDWDSDDDYLLAKLAMAEAEGQSLECKVHIILVVLNRVHDSYFPDTIEEVIFQNRNGVYQFSPIGNGRWDKVEPNEECWEALEIAKQLDGNISMGALYFENCKNADNWHSRNLELLFIIDGIRFYK